jgi:hypothetical protein
MSDSISITSCLPVEIINYILSFVELWDFPDVCSTCSLFNNLVINSLKERAQKDVDLLFHLAWIKHPVIFEIDTDKVKYENDHDKLAFQIASLHYFSEKGRKDALRSYLKSLSTTIDFKTKDVAFMLSNGIQHFILEEDCVEELETIFDFINEEVLPGLEEVEEFKNREESVHPYLSKLHLMYLNAYTINNDPIPPLNRSLQSDMIELLDKQFKPFGFELPKCYYWAGCMVHNPQKVAREIVEEKTSDEEIMVLTYSVLERMPSYLFHSDKTNKLMECVLEEIKNSAIPLEYDDEFQKQYYYHLLKNIFSETERLFYCLLRENNVDLMKTFLFFDWSEDKKVYDLIPKFVIRNVNQRIHDCADDSLNFRYSPETRAEDHKFAFSETATLFEKVFTENRPLLN